MVLTTLSFSFRNIYAAFTLLCVLVLAGCASAPERLPAPEAYLNTDLSIDGIPNARFWGDEWPKWSKDKIANYTDKDFQNYYEGVYKKPHSYLAISGGGPQGAFGAGLFAGWTASGTRPEFTMVTGISTGALTAPLAFLGPEYDDELIEVYTTTTTDNIIEHRNKLIALLTSDAVADTAPLRKLIEKYITVEVIDKIAKEHQRGRRLFIGTVNLDAGRSMIWNIGAIASSNHERRVAFIHDVLQASAAIPIAFPPIVIPVEIDGVMYDEMHVDGGTGSQVFVYPAAVDWKSITKLLKVQGRPDVYVIRNAFLDPSYSGVQRSILPIAARSISSLIRTQGIGDIYQIYTLCERDDNNFHLAYIPSTFEEVPTEEFDPVYMTKLYNLGYELAKNGYEWKKVPPGFVLKE